MKEKYLSYLCKINQDVLTLAKQEKFIDSTITLIKPSLINAKNKTYPIVRPLFYYYSPKVENAVKPFIDYILSDEGQNTVEKVGYVNLR